MSEFMKRSESQSKSLIELQMKVPQWLNKDEMNIATEEIATYIKSYHEIRSIRDDNNSEVWFYNDGIYIPNGKTYIQEICREILTVQYTTYRCNQVISKIEIDTFVDKDEFFNKQSEYPLKIALKDGVLDLETNKLEHHKPSNYFFTKLNYNYNSKAKCPEIIKFIKSIISKPEDYLTLQEMVGFSLTRHYKYEKGFMLYGEHGRNGKSKFIDLHQLLIGFNNCSSVALQDFEKDQFCLHNLQNKQVNISADLSSEAIEYTGNYKKLTGGDTITANRKFKSPVNFKNYAKMIFACNELPMVKTFTDAFWLRWVIIDFPYRFLPKNELQFHKDDPNVFLQDTEIIKRISTESEMEGFLAWAIDGYHRLSEKGHFSNETSSNRVKSFWLRKSNSVKAFLEDKVEIDYNQQVTKEEFRQKYHNYCSKHNIRQMSERAIKITLEQDLGIETKQIVNNDNGIQTKFRIWSGIKFKDEGLFNFNPDMLLNEISKQELGITYASLCQLYTDNDKLDSQLKILAQEGSICELPKGKWRVNK